MPATVSIIIVNWNSADWLETALRSILTHATVDHEILVVDNGSSDGSVEMVRQQFPGVRLLAQDQNQGFARANNLALQRATGDYLLLLNPDTELRPGALEALVDFMATHPGAGIAGPTIWNPDGSLQASTAPLPTLRTEFLRQTMLYRLFPTREQAAARQNRTRPVESVSGAALLIRRACYEQIGPLDPNIFMFYEDTDWCNRARQAGWENWFVACPGIVHIKSAASSRFARRRTLLAALWSTVYYFRKHYGPRAVVTLRGIAFCAAIARSLRAGLLWLVGRDRADQIERLHAYRAMLYWALTGSGLNMMGNA